VCELQNLVAVGLNQLHRPQVLGFDNIAAGGASHARPRTRAVEMVDKGFGTECSGEQCRLRKRVCVREKEAGQTWTKLTLVSTVESPRRSSAFATRR
jgi:hypothetical protein